jgi:septal ring factor EnvC (AmiA/AmiB activator)
MLWKKKQVAYNQIKRQDEEIRNLNAQLHQIQTKELDNKSQLTEYRRQLGNFK